MQCPLPPDRREVQIPYIEVQFADFSGAPRNVAISASTEVGTMAPTTMQIPGFRGDVIVPDHPEYDDARAVWNGTVDRRPGLIARCRGTADVAAAVGFARDRGLEIAVLRGGGHNVAGTAVCDSGIVIDLSAMRAVSVRPVERTALVQGGALWGDVDHETQAHGLATTGWIVGHTGVGGVSLGGGIGWLMRKHGLTVDNLVRAEVVTAEGEIVQASARDHPDLFWALRGGGGDTLASSPRSSSRCTRSAPPSPPGRCSGRSRTPPMSCASTGTSSPTRPMSSAPSSGSVRSRRCRCSTRSSTSGRPSPCPAATPDPPRTVSGLSAVRRFGSPLVDLVGPTLYVDHQSSIDDTVPHGWHYYWKATSLAHLSDEIIDILAAHAYGATSPRSYTAMFHMGGATRRVPPGATAYPGRERGPQHHHRRGLAPRGGRHRESAGDQMGASLRRRPAPSRCRRVRELPRLGR